MEWTQLSCLNNSEAETCIHKQTNKQTKKQTKKKKKKKKKKKTITHCINTPLNSKYLLMFGHLFAVCKIVQGST
eukprot:NODE_6290_length_461_cov_9.072816_g4773_i0.p2 GENE.NODE_6290_length_461_cov_9.072816_g4773_i0~~NODE_6290_length_461_cov_9.072816_g4773_i0.p2  ORF type:complete len:74 (-),score=12.69 NODE_6290_length_461_cov_9.072816_g4773_i0:234-455(-)